MNAEELNRLSPGKLPGLIGLKIVIADKQKIVSELEIRDELLAPNGYLHAATIIALADTSCGYGVRFHIDESVQNFTTIELKSNFLGTARDGVIRCRATPQHLGKATQVWDATVKNAHDKNIALFRCTQMIINKKPEL